MKLPPMYGEPIGGTWPKPDNLSTVLILLTILFLLISSPIHAGEKVYTDSIQVTEVTSIYDADTFTVNISQWPTIIGQRVSIRVLGIDAPEIRGKCAQEKTNARKAKEFTVEHLRKAKRIELRNIQRGKYFRLLADVIVDNESLAALLIKAGHARPYDGGTRQSWCP